MVRESKDVRLHGWEGEDIESFVKSTYMWLWQQLHHKYLRFAIRNKHYQFKALPFVIASTPRIFTKTRWRLCHTFIVADSEAHLTLTLDLLHSSGIQVNLKKSQLVPTKRIQFIGALIDSMLAKAFLPHDCALNYGISSTLCMLTVWPRQSLFRSCWDTWQCL